MVATCIIRFTLISRKHPRGLYSPGVAQPETALLDLAAKRVPSIGDLTPRVVSSAIEHRMEGLLYSWAAATERLPHPAAEPLVAADTQNWARSQMLATNAVRLESHATAHGVDICFFKGVALESQVYTRRGERPAADLDVIVRGGTVTSVTDWVAALQPRHMWIPELESLISGRHIQAIDLVVDGVQVDLHFDPLKLEIIRSRAAERLLSRVSPCDLGPGTVTGLDPEASLVLALLHLNKDRFRRLIGFADVARLLSQVTDWDWVLEYVSTEGLRTPVTASLDVVANALDLPHPVELDTVRHSRVWNVFWPERTRLLGREGVVRFRYRQMIIPFFSAGRWVEALAGIARRLFPPPPMLRAFYPDATGGYLGMLVFGRLTRRVGRARQRGAARDGEDLPDA